MDNFSHSVAGLTCGELIHRCLPPEQNAQAHRLRHRLLLLSCWISGNFPDLDLILTPLLPSPLGYLLHHRGHTHTLLYAIPQGLFIYMLLGLAWPAARRLIYSSRTSHLGLGLSITFGLLLHIAMDYLNSYGIHPFHPFDSRWLYGDMVFIVEPVFWIVFGVPMIWMIPSRRIRILLMAVLSGTLVYFHLKHYLSWPSLVALLTVGAALAAMQEKAGLRGIHALLSGLVLGLAFILLQGIASTKGKSVLEVQLERLHPGNRMTDAALTPFPSNPLCWAFVTVEINETADTYHLSKGWLSLVPKALPVASCPAALLLPMPNDQGREDFLITQDYIGKLEMLRHMKEHNCHFSAWLRFARAPAIDDRQASDLRFSPDSPENFSTLRFDEFLHQACPLNIPQWNFPRRDLLEGPDQ